MASRSVLARGFALFFSIVWAASAAYGIVELQGVTSVTLAWEPASGPVQGYYVAVSENGAIPTLETVAIHPKATVRADFGDTIRVWVAAFDDEGVPGPLSDPSEEIRFVAAGGGSSPPSTDPTDPSTGDDPGLADESPAALPARSDFTGDGISDLLVRFPRRNELVLWVMRAGRVITTRVLPSLPKPWEIVGSDDYDGDGLADLLWSSGEEAELVIWLMEAGSVKPSGTATLPLAPGWRLAGSGDFNGDTRSDLLLHNAEAAQVEFRLMDGTELKSSQRVPAPSGGTWQVAGLGDLDLDGRADVVWQDRAEGLIGVWYMGGAQLQMATLPRLEAGWSLVGAADFDGSGGADLLLHHNASGRVEFWEVDGSTVSSVTELPPAPNVLWTVSGHGDYDGNGQADLFWTEEGRARTQVWLMKGLDVSNTEVAQAEKGVELVAAGPEPAAVGACSADLDGNGSVNLADYGRLSDCFGQAATGSCQRPDLDGNGTVDIWDLRLLKRDFGARCSQ